MKTVLITGSGGFVGNHLIDELLKYDYKVIGIDRAKTKSVTGLTSLAVDLLNPDDVMKIDFTKVDMVIHLAGLAAVGPSFEEPMNYINTNVGIQVNLFETALKQKAKPKFLIISSGTLYDLRAKLPLSEASSIVPSSPYAVSKLGQEQLAQYYGLRGFEYTIARPFNHIGPGQNVGFILPDLVKQIIAVEKGQLDKVTVGNLSSKRDYTDVRDIVRAYRLLIESPMNGEIYNVCSGVAISGQEILDKILALSTQKPTVALDPSKVRPTDNPVVYSSHEKLTKDTGWMPEVSIDSTVSDVLEEWRKRS